MQVVGIATVASFRDAKGTYHINFDNITLVCVTLILGQQVSQTVNKYKSFIFSGGYCFIHMEIWSSQDIYNILYYSCCVRRLPVIGNDRRKNVLTCRCFSVAERSGGVVKYMWLLRSEVSQTGSRQHIYSSNFYVFACPLFLTLSIVSRDLMSPSSTGVLCSFARLKTHYLSKNSKRGREICCLNAWNDELGIFKQ